MSKRMTERFSREAARNIWKNERGRERKIERKRGKEINREKKTIGESGKEQTWRERGETDPREEETDGKRGWKRKDEREGEALKGCACFGVLMRRAFSMKCHAATVQSETARSRVLSVMYPRRDERSYQQSSFVSTCHKLFRDHVFPKHKSWLFDLAVSRNRK